MKGLNKTANGFFVNFGGSNIISWQHIAKYYSIFVRIPALFMHESYLKFHNAAY